MKIITKDILSFQEEELLSPIRSKVTYLIALLRATRILLPTIDLYDYETTCTLKLIIDKMSRIFILSESKYISFAFPFLVSIQKDGTISEMTSFHGKIIDNRTISAALSILRDENFTIKPLLTEYYLETDIFSMTGVELVEELMLVEPSYLRFDYDEVRANGDIHPENHIDVNYSSYGTYKLGCKERINSSSFEDLLNVQSDCTYIEF